MSAQSWQGPVAPWWRHGMVWLVVGGPLTVVVAGVATLWIAIANPDPVLKVGAPTQQSQQPAVQARNHVATPLPSGQGKVP